MSIITPMAALLGAVFVLHSSATWAQTAGPPAPPARAEFLNDPPLANEVIELSAKQLSFDTKAKLVIASGNVSVVRGVYRLNADTIEYDQNTGIVVARGRVRILDAEGNVLESDTLEITDELRDGFIENVELLLADNSRVAALKGERRGNQTTFNRAVYSPCEICEEGDEPLWQIKSIKVVHDLDKKRLYYRNAYLELLGVPVFYVPHLSHPDPAQAKGSGFLLPEARQRPELGLIFELPYFIDIDSTQDLTLTPIITTRERAVLGTEYRKQFAFGSIAAEGSVTYVPERDEFNQETGRDELRGHLFSTGQFIHGNHWRSSYQLKFASDDTYLTRYDWTDEDTLVNFYQLEGFFDNHYINARLVGFQGLRVEDETGLVPQALPSLSYTYESDPLAYNLRAFAEADTVSVTRFSGQDTRRARIAGGLRLPLNFTNGLLTTTTVMGRGDYYNVSDADRPDDAVFQVENGSQTRALGRISLDMRLPLVNSLGSFTQMLEPRVLVVAGTSDSKAGVISNEDGRSFDLDDGNIFLNDRIPGDDVWDGGTRITYGATWRLLMEKIELDTMWAQSYRFSGDEVVYPQGTGLEGDFSDFVGRFSIRISDWFTLRNRLRLDNSNFAVRRNEIAATVGNNRISVTAGYDRLGRNPGPTLPSDREELRLASRFRLNENWQLTASTVQDLTVGRDAVNTRASLIYTDECLEFQLNYRRNFTQDRDVQPGTAVTFRIVLRNLG
ncbi:MAG: LPS assembly protein LptD [Pseudomonadota bacterium]